MARDMCAEGHERNSVKTYDIFSDDEEKSLQSPKSGKGVEGSPKSANVDKSRKAVSENRRNLRGCRKNQRNVKKYVTG